MLSARQVRILTLSTGLMGGLILVLTTFPAGQLSAQDLPWVHYSSDEGLLQSVVLDALQDRHGYLWLATPRGISRFDGLEFDHFDRHHGLHNATIRHIFEDRRGRLWLASDKGLLMRRGQGFVALDVDPPDLLAQARCLVEDDEGALWVCTYGNGVVRLKRRPGERGNPAATDGGTSLSATAEPWYVDRVFDRRQGLPHSRVRAARVDGEGDLWFATDGGGVVRYEDVPGTEGRFIAFGTAQGLTNLFARSLGEDPEGHLLVGTKGGLFRLRDGRFEARWPQRLRQDVVTALHVDGRQRLWIGTRDQGICRVDGGTIRCLDRRSGLQGDSVTDVLEDREGQLWITTYGGGISRLAAEGFVNFSHHHGLPRGGIQGITEQGGRIWLASQESGALALDAEGAVAEHLTRDDGLPHDKVLAMTPSADGHLWLATLDGVAHWDGVALRILPGLASHPYGVVLALLDEGERLWIATTEGLHRLTGDPFSPTTHQIFGVGDGLPSRRANALARDSTGRLWIATAAGVSRHGGEDRFDTLSMAQGDPVQGDDRFGGPSTGAPFVFDLLPVNDDSWWFCTSDGLRHFADGSWRLFRRQEGLADDVCNSLALGGDGRLWIGTSRGISIYDGEGFASLTVGDALVSGEVRPRAAFLDASNRLWFGTARGAIAFDGDAAQPRPVLRPPIHLQEMTVAGRAVDPTAVDGPISLSPPHQDVMFQVAAVSLAYGEEMSYRYQLLPEDSSWHLLRWGNIGFPSLPPGDYSLSVQARHRGDWSDPLVVEFSIVPPWWASAWSRLGLVALALLLAWLGYRFRRRVLERRQAELERQVAQRTMEVQREKGRVRRRNDQLEIHHLIVQQINAELDFSNLLQSILEGICFVVAADRAFALVLDQEQDHFVQRACHGGRPDPGEAPHLSLQQVQDTLLSGGRQHSPGIYLSRGGHQTLPSSFAPIPTSFVVMTIELDETAAGFLVVGHTRGENELGANGIKALEGLEDHVTSAFIKGRMLDELRRLNEKKNEFLGIAAHDLRSPLGGVMSCADLLLRLLDEGRFDVVVWKKFLNNMRLTSEQMLVLVNDLLDVASIETGRVELKLEESCMSKLLKERHGLLESVARDKDIRLNLDLDADLDSTAHSVPMDRLRVGEILDNLLTNAIKYTPRGGSVRVYCQSLADELITHIEDTGQGLAKKELPWVFSGRKLSARTTEGESSHGLGLVIVKKLVELHGGRIWLDSKLGRGSTFSFSLPRISCRGKLDSTGDGAPASALADGPRH